MRFGPEKRVLDSICAIFLMVLLTGLSSSVRADSSAPSGSDWARDLDGLYHARLSDSALELLGRNGFVISPTTMADMQDIYADAGKAGQCQFVTTDAMLHVGHLFFDNLLRVIEIDRLSGKAQELTDRMLADAQDQYWVARAPNVKQAAWLNIGFFAVAKAQFNPEFRPGLGLDEIVGKELANIDAHSGPQFRELLPYVTSPSLDKTPFAYEDYSQYVPRGHYSRNEVFQQYFKAMMWFGRIDFKLLKSKPDSPPTVYGRKMTLQALLITDALMSDVDAMRLWRQIYDPTVYFVGKTDDLTVEDFQKLISVVFPGSGAERFADTGLQAEFMARARTLRAPMILSGPGGYAAENMGFRFMGQRFIPDSHIFQELVVGAQGDGRPLPNFAFKGEGKPFTMEVIPNLGPARAFPRGLDVMAVLGSARALDLLKAGGDTDYYDYYRQFEMLSKLYAATTPEQWHQNLYWRWLDALRPLLHDQAQGKGVQPFMASSAWSDKQLQTALGSWTELRHDTILYAKQSYTGIPKSIESSPRYSYGYVEPAPEVYGRLAAMFANVQASLKALDMETLGVGEKLAAFHDLLIHLREISVKELEGQPLSDKDYDLLARFDKTLAGLTRFPPELMERIASDTDSQMDAIADAHTYLLGGTVLEEAVGSPFDIFARIRDDKGHRLCRGAVFSYYEFNWPLDDRLTDEKWQQLGLDKKRPEQSDWILGLQQ
jgi:hypothetical protein